MESKAQEYQGVLIGAFPYWKSMGSAWVGNKKDAEAWLQATKAEYPTVVINQSYVRVRVVYDSRDNG